MRHPANHVPVANIYSAFSIKLNIGSDIKTSDKMPLDSGTNLRCLMHTLLKTKSIA